LAFSEVIGPPFLVINMRLVQLKCTYEQFEAIRDCIFANVPFAIVETQYSKNLGKGYFNFWDTDYIPDELVPYIVQPPLSRENKAKMTQALAEVMKSILK
jgi:hypothetical protein